MTELAEVEIATDGACKGNPGPGGWGAIIRSGTREKELSGGEALTTNNRMELTAAIRALEAAQRMEDRGASACQERGPVAGASCGSRAAPDRVAVGQGACRPRRQRARRPAGKRRGEGFAVGLDNSGPRGVKEDRAIIAIVAQAPVASWRMMPGFRT